RRVAEVERLTAEEARRPFDLERGPLLRATLLQFAATGHRLLMNIHHICSDAWSMGIFLRELGALYKAHVSGAGGRPLPELPIQYADFAVWQRRELRGEKLEKLLAWWRRQLDGASTALELPTDRRRPPVMSLRGATRFFVYPRPLVDRIEALSQRHGSSAFMTLVAAFMLLLHRHTGQRDLLVGAPIANRTRSEIEGLIGFFVNTLVLRSDLTEAGDPRFCELLARVRERALGAYAHQDLPFEKLVEELQPQRQRNRTPFFQAAFAHENAPLDVLELRDLGLAELTLRPLDTDTGAAMFDLTLRLRQEPRGLWGALEFPTELFDPATIARMVRHYRVLLESILARPEARISTLELLAPAERAQLVDEWNATATPYPRRATVHELFAARAGRSPHAVAVVWEGPDGPGAMSYGELDRRSSRLARHLRRRGVGPEIPVGLFIDRSPEMLVGILGILKAGGAYVPLDPGYPEARLRLLLEDARMPLVLSREHLAERLPQGVPALRLDDGWDDLAVEPVEAPEVTAHATGLCYVMFTSGTTGRPKGVAVPHRAVVRLVRETNFAELDAGEVFLQLAPISFDAATLEIWGPLLNGGRLVLYPGETLALEELAAVLGRHAVTTLWLTAGLFHQMVETHPQSLARLRQLLAGGDVVSAAHVRRILEELKGVLINGYGPTENTTFTCCHRMREAAGIAASVPIGRAIADTTIYLLDRNLEPVPIGVPGGLHAGGDGLSRGYFNRPALTAEAFIPDRLGAEPGGRVYRTGDLARFRGDGTVEFLGRLDTQVKIRGFRIELGEIEVALGAHPGVREVVVMARPTEARPGDKRLAAYVVPEGEATPTAAELRSFLEERLPGYMVPPDFVALEELPLDPNGKVDRAALGRRALPAPEMRGEAQAYVAPRTPTEEILAGIWGEVLDGDGPASRVGIEDDFFELGGHSLLATRALSRMRQTFGVELPLSELFARPRIAELATVIAAARRPAQPPLPPPERVSRQLPPPLSFAQQRLWFLYQLEPRNPEYNIPAAVAIAGPLRLAVLRRSLDELVRRHETLRTHFEQRAENGEEPVQLIDPPGEQPLPVIDLAALPPAPREAELRRLADDDAVDPFDLTRGPLLRTSLLRLGPERHVFLLNQHHIVSDGWSIGVLIRELGALYAGRPLPELPIRYADFAIWQRRHLRGEVLERQLAWWHRRLEGAA
ncbi:MAG: amino acid adenylation domain-containing protein, partial [bacterium]|nr:amino acid adenylation domain-containing protein [bacterium]